MYKYDFLVVGSGLYGSTFAYFAKKANKKCLVISIFYLYKIFITLIVKKIF